MFHVLHKYQVNEIRLLNLYRFFPPLNEKGLKKMIKVASQKNKVSKCDDNQLQHQKNSRFAHLSSDTQALLSQFLRKQTFRKGVKVFSIGEQLTSVYVIESGFGKISIKDNNNKDVFLSICGPGDSLGEFAIFNKNKYPVNFSALTEMTAWVLGAREFRTLCEKSEVFSWGTAEVLNGRLIRLHDRFVSMSSGNMEKRIEIFLRDLGKQYGIRQDDHSVMIPFVLKRKELAQSANTTIETAIRILSKWHKEGKVLTGKDNLILTRKFFAR